MPNTETKKHYHWADPAPKWWMYPDAGCSFNDSCLECSFRICYEDLTETIKRRIGKWSTEEIKEFLLRGNYG